MGRSKIGQEIPCWGRFGVLISRDFNSGNVGPGSGWFWRSLLSQLYKLRSTVWISPDLGQVPSNSSLI